MELESEIFELQYRNQRIQLQQVTIQQQVVFRITFSDNTKPLVIGRIWNFHEQKVWTSFPEGRLKEAQEIGPMIVSYFLAKK